MTAAQHTHGSGSPTPVSPCVNSAGNADSYILLLLQISQKSSVANRDIKYVDTQKLQPCVPSPAVASACLDKAGMRNEPSCAQRDVPARDPVGRQTVCVRVHLFSRGKLDCGVTRDPNTVIRRPGQGGGGEGDSGGGTNVYCGTFPLVNIIRASDQSGTE